MVESSEGIVKVGRLKRHAILVETAHDHPAKDLSIFEFVEKSTFLEKVEESILY